MQKLKFYDLKAKKSFMTNDYKIVIKGARKFAVATTPSGSQSYRIVAKDFKK